MSFLRNPFVALVFLTAACAERPPHLKAGCDRVLTHVQIVNPRARTITSGNLRIRDGKIVSSGNGDARCVNVMDLSGAWIIPGLVDLHVHSWGNPVPTSDESADQELGTEAVTELVLKAGVTALLDLGGDEDEMLKVRDLLRSRANPLHADFFAAGPVFLELGHAFRLFHHGPRIVSGPEDARKQVYELATKHPDVIKIIYDHANDQMAMRESTLRAIVGEAKRLGFKTVVHIGTWEDARQAIEAGASSVTHLYDDEKIPSDLPALYRKHGVLSIPTISVQCEMARFARQPDLIDDPFLAALTTPALRDTYRSPAKYSEKGRFWVEWQTQDCRENDFVSLKALYNGGVALGAGSDSGNLGTFEGYSAHREIELMVEAGVDRWTALASATTAAGDFLGQRYGVTPGDDANLVVLSANPIEHIENARKISHVLIHGELAF